MIPLRNIKQLYSLLAAALVIAVTVLFFGLLSLSDSIQQETIRSHILGFSSSLAAGPIEFLRVSTKSVADNSLGKTIESMPNGLIEAVEVGVMKPAGFEPILIRNLPIKARCPAIEEESLSQKTDLFPFKIRIKFDSCFETDSVSQVKEFLALLVFGIFVIFFVVAAFVIYPLSKLLDQIARATEPNAVTSDFRMNKFEPLQRILDQVDELKRSQTERAIGKMVQHLAHDVRRPFALLKTMTSTLGRIDNAEEIRQFASLALQEIDSSVHTVEGLIEDCLQIGAQSNLKLTVFDPATLFQDCFQELSLHQTTQMTSFKYENESGSFLSADRQKLRRAVSNILFNAMEATGGDTEITVSVRPQGLNFCRVTIENTNSFIPSSSTSKLFDSFYTSGKANGTGLGLAIAKKWVTAHGGVIKCESMRTSAHPNGTVSFIMLLPVGKSEESVVRVLSFEKGSQQALGSGQPTGQLETGCTDTAAKSRSRAAPFVVQAYDDDAVVLEGLRRMLSHACGDHLHFEGSKSPVPLSKTNNPSPHLIFLDVDFGHRSRSGIDLLPALTELWPDAKICIHSSRCGPEFTDRLLKLGAWKVVPKPIPVDSLRNLLEELRHGGSRKSPGRPKVAFVDDSNVTRLYWKKSIGDKIKLSVFESPEKFEASNEVFELVVTDMHFDNSERDGFSVAQIAKSKLPSTKIFLSSASDPQTTEGFDGVFQKNHDPRQLIEEILKEQAFFV